MTLDRLVIELPEDLKKRLKTYCATNGKTMRDEVLAMICETLESYEEAIEEEKLQTRASQGQQEIPSTAVGSIPPLIKTDSCQQIKEAEMLRKALGLKEKERQETYDLNDPLNIGL